VLEMLFGEVGEVVACGFAEGGKRLGGHCASAAGLSSSTVQWILQNRESSTASSEVVRRLGSVFLMTMLWELETSFRALGLSSSCLLQGLVGLVRKA
jgi:hypothetical protein